MRSSSRVAEVMILLSRVIKSQWTTPYFDEQKVISIKKLESFIMEEPSPGMLRNDAIQKEIISRAEAEAEMLVKEAELQAQSIHNEMANEKEAWEQEKARLIEEARQEGFSKGIAEGKEKGYNEYRNSILFAQEVVDAAKKDYRQQIASADKTILQIAIKVAEKILDKKLENDENYFAIVKNALREAREYQDVKIHVNPSHYDFLLSRKEELIAILPYENDIYIYPNDDLSDTDCLIESANGRIDAAIDSQLEVMKQKLSELLESGDS